MSNSEQLTSPYLWATGPIAAQMSVGQLVGDRYRVIAPQLWQDTQPNKPVYAPETFPDDVQAYAALYPHRLHIPEVYGFCQVPGPGRGVDLLLLSNIPVNSAGKVLPTIASQWAEATPVRQLYWLWQLLELWHPCLSAGVVGSLLLTENLRVDGWRVRLRELLTISDTEVLFSDNPLQALGELWATWSEKAAPAIASPLQQISYYMQQPNADLPAIQERVNLMLLEQAAQLPLSLQVMGLTDPGPQRSHNEDACYPTVADVLQGNSPLLPRLAIVCDGIGGHEGGEVASQLAIRSLKLQMQAFLTEIKEQHEILTPRLISQQIEAAIRVVNNLISAQNDQQSRESRQRMGTTLVMALQVPQRLPNKTDPTRTFDDGTGTSHELYLVSVGDSRAYWITPQSCCQLTVDDDIANRDIRLGYSLKKEATARPDGGVLVQALGTKDAEFLHPTVKRLILEEDGILLLCSDGLSDNDWVEKSWRNYAEPVLQGWMTLEAAVKSLIELANQENGHDNTSVILLLCRIYPPRQIQLFGSQELEQPEPEPELTEASQALLYDDPDEDLAEGKETASPQPAGSGTRQLVRGFLVTLGIGLALAGLGVGGLFLWAILDPNGFQPWRDRLPEQIDPYLPKPPQN